MIEKDLHIGEEYGVYIIDSVLPERDKWNHIIYKGICKECGFEKLGSIYDFKRKMTQQCRHIKLLTDEQFNIWYEHNKKQCLNCGKDIPFNENDCVSDYKERQFCNSSCATSYNNKKRKKKDRHNFCKNCGVEIPFINTYCSSKCQAEFNFKEYIKKWKNGEVDGMCGKYAISRYIRKFLMNEYNNKCSKCGWGEINPYTKTVPLEVHHKDGNYRNNDEDNIELLCPNCHSLTQNYKAANKGNGRKNREKYKLQ